MTAPNTRYTYVHVDTGAVETMDGFDPYLTWARHPKTGRVYLAPGYACGEPLPSWLAQNPRPRDIVDEESYIQP